MHSHHSRPRPSEIYFKHGIGVLLLELLRATLVLGGVAYMYTKKKGIVTRLARTSQLAKQAEVQKNKKIGYREVSRYERYSTLTTDF